MSSGWDLVLAKRTAYTALTSSTNPYRKRNPIFMTVIASEVPEIRVRSLNSAPIQTNGEYVLYWMTAFRRTSYNFSLDRAIDYCKSLGKPLVVLEAVRVRYPWSSRRFHQFIVDGMKANQAAIGKSPVL